MNTQETSSKTRRTFRSLAEEATKLTKKLKKREENLNKKKHASLPIKDKYIILHYSTAKVIWDWLVLVLTLYTAVLVPFVASFGITSRSPGLWFFDTMLDVFFFIDIVANFHTTYVGAEGVLITELKRIRFKYATTWFAVDLLSCLPYDAVGLVMGEAREQRFAHLLGILKALRLLRMVRIAREVDRYFEHAWATLVVMMLLIVLISHWMACGWYTVAFMGAKNYMRTVTQISMQKNLPKQPDVVVIDVTTPMENRFIHLFNDSFEWGELNIDIQRPAFTSQSTEKPSDGTVLEKSTTKDKVVLPPQNWLIRLAERTGKHFVYNSSTDVMAAGPGTDIGYIASLYFTMKTITSVGFGNIAGDTSAEHIYCVFVMVLGGLLYAVILGSVTNVIQQFTAGKQEFLDDMKAIKKFAKLNHFPPQLTESICDYVTYTNVATHGASIEKVLEGLPEHKRAEIYVYLHKHVLDNQIVFTGLDKICIQSFAKQLQRFYVAPGDVLCSCGEEVDSIRFVISGSFEVLQNGQVVALLSCNDTFGSYFWSFEDKLRRSEVKVRALTYASLDVISLCALVKEMVKFPSLKRSFRCNFELSYDLCFYFDFRTIKAKEWAEEALKSPRMMRKLYRLRRWLRKYRRRNTERQLTCDPSKTYEAVLRKLREKTQNLNARRRRSSLCVSIAEVVSRFQNNLSFLRNNRVDCEPSTSGLRQRSATSSPKPCCSKTDANSSNNNNCTASGDTARSTSSSKSVKCRKCGKTLSSDSKRNNTKSEVNLRSEHSKTSVTYSAETHENSRKQKQQIHDQWKRSNEGRKFYSNNADQHKLFYDNERITAIRYRRTVDAKGEENFTAVEECTFTLEGRQCVSMGFSEATKGVLERTLDCKTKLRKNALAIEAILKRVESVVETMSEASTT